MRLPGRLIPLSTALALTLLAVPRARAQISVTVDWGALTGTRAGPMAYGTDVPNAFTASVAQDPSYQANMAYAAPGLVRYWGTNIMDPSNSNWLGSDLQTWNQQAIAQTFQGAFPYGPTILLTIGSPPPAWLDSDQTLDPSHYTDFANLCASLVQVVNVTLGLPVTYYEIWNEPAQYQSNGATLAQIEVQAANAMKAVDPDIKVGGGVWLWALEPGMSDFIAAAAPTLDFISWHTYPTETPTTSDTTVFSSTDYGQPDPSTLQILQDIQAATNRPVETFLDEYNVNGSCWSPQDPRCINETGMVYDAMEIFGIVAAGVTGTARWDDCDWEYGMMSTPPNSTPWPTADLLHVLNGSFVGPLVTTTTSAPQSVIPWAVNQGSTQALMLINADENGSESVTVSFEGWSTPPAQLMVQQVTGSGTDATLTTSTVSFADAQSLTLPPLSATALIAGTPTGTGSTGTTTTTSSGTTTGGAASPNCTVISVTAGQITDSQGNVWTIAAGLVTENGSQAGYSANVTAMAYVAGTIYQENATGDWYSWTGTTWVDAQDPLTGPCAGTSGGTTVGSAGSASSTGGTTGGTSSTGGTSGGSTGRATAGSTSGGTSSGRATGVGPGGLTTTGATSTAVPDAGVNVLPSSGGCGCESLGAGPLPLLGWALAALVCLRRRRRESH